MKHFNRKAFFDAIRPLFGKLSTEQVAGMTALLNVWEARYSHFQNELLAYCLATSYHETAYRMQPVRETLADNDSTAIRRLNHAYNKGQMRYVSKPYWRKDSNGRAWFGRGHVQLTHQRNYTKAGRKLGVALDQDPGLALDPEISARILFSGCIDGWFTKYKLLDYVKKDSTDFYNARKVVNPGDKKTYKPIEGYANQFLAALGRSERTKGDRQVPTSTEIGAGAVVATVPVVVGATNPEWVPYALAGFGVGVIGLLTAMIVRRKWKERKNA